MFRKVLHSKIHRAVVTAALPDYVGSITVDELILKTIGLRVNDAVTVANCRTGARFETYVFRGEAGSGKIEVNGAAAHLVEPGDAVIVLHYAYMTDAEYERWRPTIAIMNQDNSVREVGHYYPHGDPSLGGDAPLEVSGSEVTRESTARDREPRRAEPRAGEPVRRTGERR
ncbi:MAG: aspartate 1-decarboxylase [Phycisphaerales bacterium]|nr:aspartate 1-decarboxylase [Phycisphaerales bacterium]